MKKITKMICSAAVLCGAFSMPGMTAYAEETTGVPEVTNIVSSEKITLDVTKPIVTETTSGIGTVTLDDLSKEVIEKLGIPLGNGILLEDKNDDVVDRQFLTVQSKNGNTFYLIVDKDSAGKENVYFLNMVDEYDLMAFTEDFPEDEEENDDKNNKFDVTDTSSKLSNQTKTDVNSDSVSQKTDKATNGNNNIMLLLIGLIGLAAGGALYYFKFVKGKAKTSKKNDYIEDDEDYQEEMFNEDSAE